MVRNTHRTFVPGSSPTSPSSASASPSDGSGFCDIDPGDAALPLVIIATGITIALASLYIVWIAPGLLAELLFDGVLSYTLYRHLRARQGRHWLATALRRTALPFACAAVFLSGTGLAMAVQGPCARSIGDVVRHVKARRAITDAQVPHATVACVQRPHRNRVGA